MAHGGYGKRRVAERRPMNRRFKGGLGIDKKKKKPKTVSIKNQIRSTERMLRKVFINPFLESIWWDFFFLLLPLNFISLLWLLHGMDSSPNASILALIWYAQVQISVVVILFLFWKLLLICCCHIGCFSALLIWIDHQNLIGNWPGWQMVFGVLMDSLKIFYLIGSCKFLASNVPNPIIMIWVVIVIKMLLV